MIHRRLLLPVNERVKRKTLQTNQVDVTRPQVSILGGDIGHTFFKINLEDTSPFCGDTDISVVEFLVFWWHPPGVSKPG